MKVHVHFVQPPRSPYFSLAYSAGGQFVAIQMHHDKPSEDKEFDSMDEFFEYCKSEGVQIPWVEE